MLQQENRIMQAGLNGNTRNKYQEVKSYMAEDLQEKATKETLKELLTII